MQKKLKRPSCISEASYVVFLFKERKLFHISIRAIATKDCNDYTNLFARIPAFFNIPIAKQGKQEMFIFNGEPVRLIGTRNPRGAMLDIIKPGIAESDGDQAVP